MLTSVRFVAGFAVKGLARYENKSRCVRLLAGGVNDAESAFTGVAARAFASPPSLQSEALSFHSSGGNCSSPDGIRLSGERVISRAKNFHLASSTRHHRTYPLHPAREDRVLTTRLRHDDTRRQPKPEVAAVVRGDDGVA